MNVAKIKLDSDLLRKFCVAKTFRGSEARLNSLSFSMDGEMLITSSKDDQIVIFDCNHGVQQHLVSSQKYGVNMVKFTHTKSAVIHASTKIDDDIRYLSLENNTFIRYFKGHTRKVVCLEMAPNDDSFISASEDNTVRLWDLRIPSHRGIVEAQSNPICAFDPNGLVFSVGTKSEWVKLYDIRLYEKGPFATFHLPKELQCYWTGIKYSPNRKRILLTTNGNQMRLIDALNGRPLQTLAGYVNSYGIPLDACFSPNSNFVIGGSTDGHIHAWSTESGLKVCVLNGGLVGPVQCVQFNPCFAMMASACSHLSLWLPNLRNMNSSNKPPTNLHPPNVPPLNVSPLNVPPLNVPPPNVPPPNVPPPNVTPPNVPTPNVPTPNVPTPNVPSPNVPPPNMRFSGPPPNLQSSTCFSQTATQMSGGTRSGTPTIVNSLWSQLVYAGLVTSAKNSAAETGQGEKIPGLGAISKANEAGCDRCKADSKDEDVDASGNIDDSGPTSTAAERKPETLPIILKTHEPSLKVRQESIISLLYDTTAFKCKSCGQRFDSCQMKTGEAYVKHLDWHYRMNRREKERKMKRKMESRQWYLRKEEWLACEEIEDEEFENETSHKSMSPVREGIATVVLDPDRIGVDCTCPICGEEFIQDYIEAEHSTAADADARETDISICQFMVLVNKENRCEKLHCWIISEFILMTKQRITHQYQPSFYSCHPRPRRRQSLPSTVPC